MKLIKCLKCVFALTGIIIVLPVIPVMAVQIFSESFESPVVSGTVSTTPSGWTSTRTDKTGLSNTAMAGKTGSQYAHIDDYPSTGLFDGALTTTASILNSYLTTNLLYTLTCNVSGAGTSDGVAMDFLAGTNVVASVTNGIATITNLSARTLTIKYAALPGNLNVGQALAIRLRMTAGAWD